MRASQALEEGSIPFTCSKIKGASAPFFIIRIIVWLTKHSRSFVDIYDLEIGFHGIKCKSKKVIKKFTGG